MLRFNGQHFSEFSMHYTSLSNGNFLTTLPAFTLHLSSIRLTMTWKNVTIYVSYASILIALVTPSDD
jgi:hypothetical protein